MLSYLGGGQHNAERLFDGDTSTAWFPGWDKSHYPATVVVDLQSTRQLAKIKIYDGTGKPTLRLSASLDGQQYAPVLELPLEQYATWVERPLHVEARFLQITLSDPQGDTAIGELELYEADTAELEGVAKRQSVLATPTVPLKPRSGEALKMGANGFHWVPLELLSPFHYYREYQCWDWMEQEKGLCRFEPTDGASGKYDTHYTMLRAQGIKPIACVNQTPEWLLTGYPNKPHRRDFKPVPWGESPSNPASYRYFARFLFQLAARYGRANVKHEALTINPASRWHGDGPNQKKTGLDLLEHIEVWNEPDKWWADAEAYFEPEEYAAMLSACYDGHEGQLGRGYGIRTADPTMNVVMGGLSNFNLDYLKAMVAWCRKYRKDKRFPAQVVNFHHYCNQNQALKPNFERGIAPEEDRLKEKLKILVDYTRRELPGKLFWFTEFGYDTHPSSPQRVEAFGTHDTETTQGIWLQRCYLESIAAGVDAAFMYNIIDENPGENASPTGAPMGLFQSSGLARGEKAGFVKKSSWQQIADLAATLDGAHWKADHSTGQLRAYVFKKGDRSFTLSWSTNNTISERPTKH